VKVVEKAGKPREGGILAQLQAYIDGWCCLSRNVLRIWRGWCDTRAQLTCAIRQARDNESIDVDLVQGCGGTHEEQSAELAQWDRLSDEALMEFERGL